MAAGWKGGIREAVISLTGLSETNGTEEVAMLISEYGWEETTWTNRLRQVRKSLRCFEEEGREALSATEGDVR